ncbi:MAG: hypothetical protein H7Y31_01210 [Chitinophagaceae bacterium]|nr:hypothetical protein [Chitinophagaceae bacterium]
MKFNSLASMQSGPAGNFTAFDAVKFGKMVKAKEARTWWKRFMTGVDDKRTEIKNELALLKGWNNFSNH